MGLGLRNDSHDSGFKSLEFGEDSDTEQNLAKPAEIVRTASEERKIASPSVQLKPSGPLRP